MLKTKKDIHLARKVWHISGVAVLCAIYLYMPYDKLIPVGGFLTVLVFLIDFCRLKFSSFNNFTQKVFGIFLRKEEKKKLTGLSYMVLGTYLVAVLFPEEVVLTSYLFLGLGDPAASYVGILYGKNKIGAKSFEGSMASFIVCALVSMVLFSHFELFAHRIFIAVPIAALIGSVSELVQVKYIDDNMSLPMLSGFGVWTLVHFLGV